MDVVLQILGGVLHGAILLLAFVLIIYSLIKKEKKVNIAAFGILALTLGISVFMAGDLVNFVKGDSNDLPGLIIDIVITTVLLIASAVTFGIWWGLAIAEREKK